MNQSKPDTKDQLHRHLVELKEQVAQLETQQGNQSAKSAGEIIEAVLERMPIGVLVVGKNRIIRKANACAMKIFGVSESQIVGKHCRQVMEHQDDHRCPIWDMERSIDHWEKHVVNNGKKNTFMKTAFPVTWAGEQMLLEFLIDITAEKKAEAQLRKQRENRRKTGQIKVQQALYQISNAVHTTKNLTDLFEVIQVELGRIIDTNNFFIAL
ncbi:MAG: PAS domain-containing protein, partial [bacterium]|nr:PAS domain-containing protein [bacterium]